MLRSTEEWKAILIGKLVDDAAKVILSDIAYYRHGGIHEGTDIQQLANALQAWKGLSQQE